MRILMVNATGSRSGAENVLLGLARQALSLGHRVTVAVPDGPTAEAVDALGATRLRIPELGLRGTSRAVAAARASQMWGAAARVLRREQREADIVVANSLLALPAVRLARLRTPTVWLAHDVLVDPLRLALYRAAAPALTGVVAVSEAVAQVLRDVSPPAQPWVETVHNGIALTDDPRTARPPGPPVVGISALLTPWKGHHLLLDAMLRLPGDVELEIMGGTLPTDTAYAAGLADRIEHSPRRATTRLLGHVPDPTATMRTWSVAVSASLDPEACPLGVLESMSQGLPVVVSDHGGAVEVLRGAGLPFRVADPDDLARALRRLLVDDDLYGRSATTGPVVVRRFHEPRRQLTALLTHLERAVGGTTR